MAENLLSWVTDTFARSDIIDLYFIISDLVDIDISEAERCENAYFDAFASQTVEGSTNNRIDGIPIGKMVW